MNGAEAALRTAVAAGVDVCFANPGTTEMELVAALDAVPGIRGVLGLFEGVVTGAADGYARVTGRPALTLLHLGPGFANGIANLHNARRAFSPVVNLIGDHATWHVAADAPLTSDISSLASPVSKHVGHAKAASGISADLAAAITAARTGPTGVASLIVAQDAAWGDAPDELASVDVAPVTVDAAVVDHAAAALRAAGPAGTLVVGGTVTPEALEAAARIEAVTGAKVWLSTFPARLAGGRGRHRFDAVPYFPEQGIAALAPFTVCVLAGAAAPVAFFGYPKVARSSLLADGCEVLTVALEGTPIAPALGALADALGARPPAVDDRQGVDEPTGALDVITFGAMVAARQPEHAIVVNEAATSGLGWAIAAPGAAPHDSFSLTGGAIGYGLPAAVGAAIAAPDRKVVALQADGSGMYTLQALWTMARENLDVTVLVCANRAYRILQMELHRAGNDDPGPTARRLTDLGAPPLDWVHLAQGCGVPASRATTLEELRAGIDAGLTSGGPSLVEVLL